MLVFQPRKRPWSLIGVEVGSSSLRARTQNSARKSTCPNRSAARSEASVHQLRAAAQFGAGAGAIETRGQAHPGEREREIGAPSCKHLAQYEAIPRVGGAPRRANVEVGQQRAKEHLRGGGVARAEETQRRLRATEQHRAARLKGRAHWIIWVRAGRIQRMRRLDTRATSRGCDGPTHTLNTRINAATACTGTRAMLITRTGRVI